MGKNTFRTILLNVVILLIYIASGKAGLAFASINPSASAIWPPTGIALAALLIFGYRVAPSIFLGAFIVNLTTAGTTATSVGIAFGNGLEGLVGTYLIRKFANGRYVFDSLAGIVKFTLFAAILSTMVSATIGVTTITLGGFAKAQEFWSIWLTWWLGDMGGNIVIAPLLLIWSRNLRIHIDFRKILNLFISFVGVIIVTTIIFQGIIPYAYLCIPIAVWIAFWFGQKGATATTIFVAIIAIYYTLHGLGPFAKEPSTNQSLLLLQMFLNIFSLTALTFATTSLTIKKAEKKLLQEKLEDEAMLVSIGEGIIATDDTGRITLVNQATCIMLGWSKEELIGQSVVDVIPMQDEKENVIAKESRPLTKVLKSGKKIATSLTQYYVSKNRIRFPVVFTLTPVILDGKVVGTIEVFRDMTEERAIDNAKDEFISLVSHELRTPMTAIRGLTSMILKGDYGKFGEKLKDPLQDIAISTERLIHLINDLLDVSRMQAGRITFSPKDLLIGKIIDKVVTSLNAIAQQKGVKIQMEKTPEILVHADEDKTIEVLNNLIDNAIKFTDKGTVSITCEQKGQLLTVFIIDQGIGIAQQDKKRLFGKFEQINSQQEGRPAGTGLGLYISKSLAIKMGGDVWLIKSEKGKGSTFAFSLPIVDES